MIIGITGGTGCGKTTLLDLIREKGGLVLDCDAVYRELLATDKVLLQSISDRFPGTVSEGVLDRKKLGRIVFADRGALEDLNRLTHGAIAAEVKRRLETAPELAAIDAIGLFEGGLAALCDTTVAVTAPEDVRVQRLMARDHISREYALSRIAAQHTEEWFRQRCDHVLRNDSTIETFYAKCLAFLQELAIIDSLDSPEAMPPENR